MILIRTDKIFVDRHTHKKTFLDSSEKINSNAVINKNMTLKNNV